MTTVSKAMITFYPPSLTSSPCHRRDAKVLWKNEKYMQMRDLYSEYFSIYKITLLSYCIIITHYCDNYHTNDDNCKMWE